MEDHRRGICWLMRASDPTMLTIIVALSTADLGRICYEFAHFGRHGPPSRTRHGREGEGSTHFRIDGDNGVATGRMALSTRSRIS